MKFACLKCGKPSELKYCEQHRGSTRTGRPSFKERGYGQEFARNRQKLLANKPLCVKCGSTANTAHHQPARKLLVAMKAPEPDSLAYLEPYCRACHTRETAQGR